MSNNDGGWGESNPYYPSDDNSNNESNDSELPKAPQDDNFDYPAPINYESQYDPNAYSTPPAYGNYGQSPEGQKLEPLSVAAIVTAVISLLCCGILLAPVSLALATASRRNVAKSPSLYNSTSNMLSIIAIAIAGISLFLYFGLMLVS